MSAGGFRQLALERLEARGSLRRWVLFATLAGMFAHTFPFTILAVSVGAIASEFGVRETTMAWVISAPMLFSAVALPVLGKLGDLYGHRLVFLAGSWGATLIAFGCAFAWSPIALISLRTLSAVVGGTTQPSSMAIIFSVYGPGERLRAMGWWSMTGALSPALGLVLGGPLVDLLGWRVLFVVQAALAVVAAALAWLVLSETPRQRVRFDVAGSITLTVGVGALMVALASVRDLGLHSARFLLILLLGVAGLFAFVAAERRAAEPLLPLQLFGVRNFTAPMLSSGFMGGAYMGAFVLAPMVLTDLFAFSISATAGAMLLRTMTLSVSSPLGGRLGERIGERGASLVGTAAITVSMAALAVGSALRSLSLVGAGLLFQGLGQGLCLPSLNSAVAGAVAPESLGVATAAHRLVSQVGTAFGITVMTMAYGGTPHGFLVAFLVGVGISALSVLAAAAMSRGPRAAESA